MKQEIVINLIKNFGPKDLSSISMLIMRKALGLTPISVDGVGDGGRDVIFTSYEENNKNAVQITAQDKGWKEKIKNDLKKITKPK